MAVGDCFTCPICKGRFVKGRSDEEALDDMHVRIGSFKSDKVVAVCGKCSALIFAWWKGLAEEEREAILAKAPRETRQ